MINLMSRISQKIKKQYLQYGLKQFVTNMLSTLSSKIFITSDDIIITFSLQEFTNYASSKRIKILPLEESQIPNLKEFCRNHDCTLKDSKKLNNYLENGFNAFLATVNDEIIGYYWWTDNRILPINNHPHLIRYGISLMDNEVYTFDIFILPKHRGSGNAVEFLTTIWLRLKEQGFQKIYGWVFADNKQARWLYRLMGYKEGKVIKSYRILKLISITDNKIFIRNNKMYSRYSFDYRPLLPYSFMKNGSHR